MRNLGAITIGLLAVTLSVQPSGAATIYTAEGNVAGGYDLQTTSSGTAFADTGYVVGIPAPGTVARGQGISSQYGVGAAAELTISWFGSYFESGGRGKAETDVFFGGPTTGELIPVSVNLFLEGGFGGGYVADQTSTRWVDLSITLYNAGYATGRIGEQVTAGVSTPILGGDLAPDGLACLTASGCLIESPTFLAPANVWLTFSMEIVAKVGASSGVGYAGFMDTLYFPLGQDVFNLPDGYTADMPGLSVVNNRVFDPNGGGGAEVPEPGTYALVGAGLAVALARRRKAVRPRS